MASGTHNFLETLESPSALCEAAKDRDVRTPSADGYPIEFFVNRTVPVIGEQSILFGQFFTVQVPGYNEFLRLVPDGLYVIKFFVDM